MEVQLIRESIRLERPLGTAHSTAVVTGDVTLPGGLREETRILAAQAMAAPESADAAAGRVNVRGRVTFHVLYTQGDPTKVSAIEASADFTQPCELTGAQARSMARAETAVQRVEARAVNGRLSLRAEVDVAVEAASLAPVEAVTAVDGTDDAQVRSRQQSICRTAARGSSDVLLREELPLPEGMMIREALFAGASPLVEEVTGGVGRAGVSGQVLLEAVHASSLPGRPVVVTRHSIPFAESVALEGEDGELLSGSAVIRDVAVALQEDGDGLQSLRAEVLLGLEGRADTMETLSILEDAYTTSGEDLCLTGETMLCRTGSGCLSAAESGKATLMLPHSAPPVRTVLAAFVHPQMEQRENRGGRTTVSGSLDTTLLYMTDGSEAPVSIRLNEPFRTTFAADVPQSALVTLSATEAEAVPVTSDRVELRCILRLQARSDAAEPVTLVTEGQLIPAAPQTEDVVLYFTQPGETLWDIARRYRLPVAGVQALNPALTGEPQPGQGVVVWRRSGASAV